LINITISSKIKANRSKWFFDNYFKWGKATVKIETGSEKLSVEGEIRFNERGLYFADVGGPDLSKLNKFSYGHNVEGKKSNVFDFQLVQGCKFDFYDLTFGGKGLKFVVRDFNAQRSAVSHNFDVYLGFLAKLLGSFDTKKMAQDLAVACNERKEKIKKETLEALKEIEKKRIEAQKLEEERKAGEEAASKKKAQEEATGKKKAEDESAANKKKAEEEEERKRKQAEEERKRIEKELQEKYQKEIADKISKVTISSPIASTQIDEKKNIEIEIYRILINYDCGFGRAFYITGSTPDLGQWKKATKLDVKGKDLWAFQSSSVKDNVEFKVIIYNWIEGATLDLETTPKHLLRWEGKPGPEGNNKTKFVNFEMKYTPNFPKKKKF